LDIIDNLAQIDLILTDKTGTLTTKVFKVQSVCIGSNLYGQDPEKDIVE
jgi:P-type E1-E2 ATPase